MLLKALIGVAIFIATTVAAIGREETTNETPTHDEADFALFGKPKAAGLSHERSHNPFQPA
jgi:hypothetical protein